MKLESEKTTETNTSSYGTYTTNYLDIIATFDEEEMIKINKYIEFWNQQQNFITFCKENNFPFATAITDPDGKGPFREFEIRYGWVTWVPEKSPIVDLLIEQDDIYRDNVTIVYKDPAGNELKLPEPFYNFILTHDESWIHSWC